MVTIRHDQLLIVASSSQYRPRELHMLSSAINEQHISSQVDMAKGGPKGPVVLH